MPNQVNMTAPKEMNKAPITDPEEMDIYDMFDKEFKTFKISL